MFVVCRLQEFDFEQSPEQRYKLPFPITVDAGKMVGFLPVYETEEDALKDYPAARIKEISFGKGE